ncbi:ABC transporter substrate-binding protein [Phytoactinopolyspora halotolerans]|uniref:ABC transporter substrate-binding protein n=1 Tax=Phytoactinopolyspora halotolerans TaxID=1981512 RepID=A0A6L9S0Y3_9ACTN|nr:ABC transporter substrate-binding protein [Phytoactinopolyspora halotolerans]NED98618.1 ABC transporter substrate-binding protein [Phytoactinopolyspora halotolerans]
MRRGAALAGTVALATLAACGNAATDDEATTAADATPTGAATASGDSSPAGTSDATSTASGPVIIDNCGLQVTVDAPPQRAVTMNQSATEVMLALGLEDRMAGTAYLDDAVLPQFADAYATVPVLSEAYPSQEALLDAEPDAVYGAYPSAFQPDAAGDRAELHELGVSTYLSPAACPDKAPDEPLEIETVWQEIQDIGAIFGATDQAAALVEQQRSDLAEAVAAADDMSSTTVMWWDGGTDAPSVGACCGAPGMIMNAAGLQNVFADIEGNWADVSWEQVAERDPDVIVLVDAEWSTAEEKRDTIESTPGARELPAVADGRFVEVPFSATTPGVRNVRAVADLITGVEGLQ